MLLGKVYPHFVYRLASRQAYIYLIFIILLFSKCNDDDVKPIGHINNDFQDYVDRFVTEAQARGIKVDTLGLSVVYSDTLKAHCGWGVFDTKTVQISTIGGCFKSGTDDLTKEALIFHELGHALLNRQHDDSFLPNDDKRSLMTSSDLSVIYNRYFSEKRTYYLDELFNPDTTTPAWGYQKLIPTIIFQDSIRNPSKLWNYYSTGSTNTGKVNSSIFYSPSSSLQITAPSPSKYSDWSKFGFPLDGINQSDRVEFSARLELDNVTGDGVIIRIAGYTADGKIVVIGTNEFQVKINGSSNFAEYLVAIPYYSESTVALQIDFIMANNSTGTAYFDDAKVTVYK